LARVGVAIMAHPRRSAFVAELLAKLDRPATVVWDSCNDRWDTGRRTMLEYRSDTDATYWLALQDDAVIPRDLVAGIEKALRVVPAKTPLCLYAGRARPLRAAVQQLVDRTRPDTSWLAMGQLHWGVGIVMPCNLIEPMITWADRRTEVANYDKRISRWCQTQGLNVWYPWPSLVDHRISPSLVPGRQAAGRHAHRFIGEDASALDQRYDGQVVTIRALSNYRRGGMAAKQLDLWRRQLRQELSRVSAAQKRIRLLQRQIAAAEQEQPEG